MSFTAEEKTPKPSRASRQIAWRLLLTVHAVACRRIDRDLQEAGCITFDDYDLLLTLNEAEGESLRMSELAEAVLLSNSGLSRRVVKLVERGLVQRKQCTRDGRVFHVHLSSKGRKALDQAWTIYENLIEQSFASHMTRDEAHTISLIFQRILDRTGLPSHQGLLLAKATDAPKKH
ncbi:MarR family winged helix-turn-helix transcriptional regulator [Haloferula sp.]|uniref:MarR family winged helix-turn-helix transcriptional regulator n=1 Tax=Haloferula sp. TaxID=2497595 RepID=UPI003C760DB8